MARIFIEGWEGNSFDGWVLSNGTAQLVSTSGLGMSGLYCIYTQYGAVNKNLFISYDSLYLAFKYRIAWGSGNRNPMISFYDSAGAITAGIYRSTSTGKIEIRRGIDTDFLLDTGDIILSSGVTYLIEVYFVPLNSGGTILVKVDGTVDADSGSADTTKNLENVQTFRFGFVDDQAGNSYIDDIVVDDADWIGNTKIQAQFPTGAGATTGLSPSSGANWDCVEEKPFSDTDYVYGNTANLVDTYATSDLAESVNSIKCIQLSARCAYAGSPTPTKQGLVIRPASTDRVHATDITPGISFSRHDRIWELNPEDSQPFEAADLNAMEIGVKLVA